MLVGEWDFEREKEVARQETWQEAERYYGAKLQTASAQLQTEKTASAQYKAQLRTVSDQLKSSNDQIQVLQEEIRKLRTGR